MPALTVFTTALGAEIIKARTIGSTVNEAIAAAGVNGATAYGWLKRGRAWNAGERDDIGSSVYADFARDFDAARSVYLRSLRAHRASGVGIVTADPAVQLAASRLAHDIIKHEESSALRNQELKLMKQRVRVETNRADGTHIERHEVRALATLTDEEIDERERAAIAAAGLVPALHS